MNSFIDYQRRLSALVDELTSLKHQYQRAVDEDYFWEINRLTVKMKRIRQELGELKIKMLESRGQYLGHKNAPKPQTRSVDHLPDASQVVERIESLYIFLEEVAMNEARHFSNHDKGRLRRARADVQRIRLWLYDVTGMKPSRHMVHREGSENRH